jgi:hypothetical protein
MGDQYWVFLGTFTDGRWQTRYLDFSNDFNPTRFGTKDAIQRTLKVRNETGGLNLRYGKFSDAGDYPPLERRPLQPGQAVQLNSVAQWCDSGHWWATIDSPK